MGMRTLGASEEGLGEQAPSPIASAAPPAPPSTRSAARRSMETPPFMTVLLHGPRSAAGSPSGMATPVPVQYPSPQTGVMKGVSGHHP